MMNRHSISPLLIMAHKQGQYCTIYPDENINGYTAVKKLGKGHYSTVWEAAKGDEKIAIKVFRSSSHYREVFDNELVIMKLVASFSGDPNSIYVSELKDAFAYLKIYYGGAGKCEAMTGTSVHPCLAMPIYGESLYDLLRSEPYYDDEYVTALPIPSAKNIMIQILKGLSFLHKNNIVHTDINTNNILLRHPIASIENDGDIQVIISDLGTAFDVTKPLEGFWGTKEYQSPEQLINMPLTVQTDIWSAGCVFYELVTNSLLFDFSDGDDALSHSGSDSDSNDSKSHSDVNNENETKLSDEHTTRLQTIEDESDDDSKSDSMEEWNEGYMHFIMMEGLLGPAPHKITKNAPKYFNKRGKLRNNPAITRVNTMEMLHVEFEYTQAEITGISGFLFNMVGYIPSARKTADELLMSKYLRPKTQNSKKRRGKKNQTAN